MRYKAFTCRIFYLTGKEKDFMYFGTYTNRKLAIFVSKICAIVRDIFTRGEWDGVKFGVIDESIL